MPKFALLVLICLATAHAAMAAESVETSFRTLERAAEAGDAETFNRTRTQIETFATPEAYKRLGRFYENLPTAQVLRVPDYAAAAEYYRRAIAAENPNTLNDLWAHRARKRLATLYLEGQGVPRDAARAAELLKPAAEAGHAGSAYAYAQFLERGFSSQAPDVAQAARWYRFALREGYGQAALALAALYREGRITPPSAVAADDMTALGLSLLKKRAMEGGNRSAMALAETLESDAAGAPNPAQALTWYRLAARRGTADAWRAMARMYGEGRGVARNRLKAGEYMQNAATLGDMQAALALGRTLTAGKEYFLKTSPEVALLWLRRAVDLENTEALRLLSAHHLQRGEAATAVHYLEKAAAQGSVAAMLMLYDLYGQGKALPADTAKAQTYFAMARGNPEPSRAERARIAAALLDPKTSVYRRDEGLRLMHTLAESGHVPAMVRLGEAYTDARLGLNDAVQALKWYARAAEAGDGGAMLWLAQAYAEGKGVAKDRMKAQALMNDAIKRVDPGDAVALTKIGTAYKNGKIVPKSTATAARWFERAMQLGHTPAKFELGRVAVWGNVPNYTPEEAARLLEETAQEGHAGALLELGRAYGGGMGVKTDHRKALDYFLKAAAEGIPEGARQAGLTYLSGLGVPADPKQAEALLLQAANAGNAAAMLDLAMFYDQGAGATRDATQSLAWLRKAAESGLANAQYFLGKAYREGDAVPQDLTRADTEFRKAAAQGHMLALEALSPSAGPVAESR